MQIVSSQNFVEFWIRLPVVQCIFKDRNQDTRTTFFLLILWFSWWLCKHFWLSTKSNYVVHTNFCILDITIITVIIANISLCVFIWVLLPTIRGEIAIVLSIKMEKLQWCISYLNDGQIQIFQALGRLDWC